MYFKKKFVTITLLILFIIVAALGTVFVTTRLDKGAQQKGAQVTSRYFKVTLPDGATLTNNEGNHNVYAMSTENFGELRVSINRSTAKVTQLVQRGEIVKQDTTVDGVAATKQLIDYSKIIPSTTSKLQIRYEVQVKEIPKPSSDEYTNISVVAMSKRQLTAAEKAEVAQKADALLRSIEIK